MIESDLKSGQKIIGVNQNNLSEKGPCMFVLVGKEQTIWQHVSTYTQPRPQSLLKEFINSLKGSIKLAINSNVPFYECKYFAFLKMFD